MVPVEVIDEVLSNGVRVVTEGSSATKSISLGFWVEAGSRDEGDSQWGCSHFLEHLLFKGTKTRSAREISSVVENLGGHLNAFTDRDMTAYFARVLSRDQSHAVELLSDMLQNSLLRADDVEMERRVILEEIKQVWDDPGSLIHELYTGNIWRDHPLAHPILGTVETISSMGVEEICGYYREKYGGSFLVVAAGDVEHGKLVSCLENYIEKGRGKCEKDRSEPRYFPGKKYVQREMGQVQLAVSAPGLPFGDPGAVAQVLISSYLGVGASSRLFQEVREKRGLVYNIYGYNQSLSDVGVFSVFAGMSKRNLGRVIEIILREFEAVKQGLSFETLEMVKHKTVGQFILGSESNRHRMQNLGVSTLRTGKPRSVEDVVSRIEGVTIEDISRVAGNLFDGEQIAITALGISESEVEDLESIIE
jgi:predicted Zn-dependent peptidase